MSPSSESPQNPFVGLGVRAALVVLFLVALTAAFFVGRSRSFEPRSKSITVYPSPNVLVAVHDLNRLESVSFHMERVVELTDEQTRAFGLLHAKDAILLVAVGDVTAGVDLSKVAPTDVEVDWTSRRVHLRLPPPEVFTAAIDNTKTHVYSRSTDILASRNEQLEGAARSEAETSMRKAAVEGGILDRAQERADASLRAFLKSLGFEVVELLWAPH